MKLFDRAHIFKWIFGISLPVATTESIEQIPSAQRTVVSKKARWKPPALQPDKDPPGFNSDLFRKIEYGRCALPLQDFSRMLQELLIDRVALVADVQTIDSSKSLAVYAIPVHRNTSKHASSIQ